MKILSFGSLNYDYTYEVEHFLAPKETLAAKSMQRGFGGKGANQSIAFARAGLSVYHAGRVGADGQPFVDYLKQNGIHTDYLIKDDAAATGHAIIEVCRGENCILIYGGANREITTEQIDHTLKAFSPGDWLVLQNEISNLPYLMQAVDTTAAGDTYSGYFLAGLCSGSSIEDSMRLATKAAGIAVQRKGAAASIPEIKELK